MVHSFVRFLSLLSKRPFGINSTPFTLAARTEREASNRGEGLRKPTVSVHPQRESFKVIAFDKVHVNSKLFQKELCHRSSQDSWIYEE
jgi:hypothetical protein